MHLNPFPLLIPPVVPAASADRPLLDAPSDRVGHKDEATHGQAARILSLPCHARTVERKSARARVVLVSVCHDLGSALQMQSTLVVNLTPQHR